MRLNKNHNVVKRFASKGVFPYQFAFTLLIPLRIIFLSPKTLIKRLGLKEDSVVLEIGPGPGFFSDKVARTISKGKLYLTDIQKEMLDYAKKRLLKKNISNAEFKLCDGNSLPFESDMFDVVFLVAVLGEISNKNAYIKEIFRVLRKNGTLSISELPGDPDNMTIEEIQNLVEEFGFKPDKIYGAGRNFTVNFTKE